MTVTDCITKTSVFLPFMTHNPILSSCTSNYFWNTESEASTRYPKKNGSSSNPQIFQGHGDIYTVYIYISYTKTCIYTYFKNSYIVLVLSVPFGKKKTFFTKKRRSKKNDQKFLRVFHFHRTWGRPPVTRPPSARPPPRRHCHGTDVKQHSSCRRRHHRSAAQRCVASKLGSFWRFT